MLQHNGGGSLSVTDFVVEDFGKLYRSCGNCDSMYERHFSMSGGSATSGSIIAGECPRAPIPDPRRAARLFPSF